MSAPDYVEPTIGWRVWDVVDVDGSLRLRSPAFLTIWAPSREAVALCRRSDPNVYLGGHRAPHERCCCGIYAAKRVSQAAPYLSRLFPRRPTVVHRVIGRVSLWGSVVECERGWRAARAYPLSLFVPAASRRRRPALLRLPAPLVSAERIALALADYKVPLELIDCRTKQEVVSALDDAAGLGRP